MTSVSAGPCLIAENNGRSVDCDVSGMFKPLQCNSIDDSIALRCVCVLPSSGDPLAGTEVIVIELDDAPDCSAIGSTWSDCVIFLIKHYSPSSF